MSQAIDSREGSHFANGSSNLENSKIITKLFSSLKPNILKNKRFWLQHDITPNSCT
jgi:hypothetical protein